MHIVSVTFNLRKQYSLDVLRLCAKAVLTRLTGWGGIPTTTSLEGLSKAERNEQGYANGVIKLTFVSSFVLPEGASLVDAIGGSLPPWVDVLEVQVLPPHIGNRY
jgi:hypothetical protein